MSKTLRIPARDCRMQGPIAVAWATAFLLLTVAAVLLKVHASLMHGDDLFELFCDRLPTLRQVLHVEMFSPLAVDPILNHAVIHGMVRLAGMRPTILVLPALIGFVIMQACTFCFVRRIASPWAAVLALALSQLSGAAQYASSIRPYGLQLGLFGLAMVSWQSACRPKHSRTIALVTLAVSIALAINAQYYGILIPLPLLAAEVVRSYQCRCVDRPMLISIAAGLAGVACTFPFLHGATRFQGHFDKRPIPIQAIAQTYSFLITGHSQFSVAGNRLLRLILLLGAAFVLSRCVALLGKRSHAVPRADFVFIGVLAVLPFAAFMLGRLATHAMEARYVLGSVFAMSALLSVALDSVNFRPTFTIALLAITFLGSAWQDFIDVRAEQRQTEAAMKSMPIDPQVWAAAMASPSQLLYMQDVGLFAFLQFHDPDATTLSHIALVYSVGEERHFNSTAASSMVSTNLKAFTDYTILPYEEVKAGAGPHLFIVNRGGWSWIEDALAGDHAEIDFTGYFMGNRVVSVLFPQPLSPSAIPGKFH